MQTLPQTDSADEITIGAPELPPIRPADRIRDYLTGNPPSAFPAPRSVSELQDALRHFPAWATYGLRGCEILVHLLGNGRFVWPRSAMRVAMTVGALVEAEYHDLTPVGRANQIYARCHAVRAARNAVWESEPITILNEFSESFGLTPRMILEQVNQAVATAGTQVFRSIGIAAPTGTRRKCNDEAGRE